MNRKQNIGRWKWFVLPILHFIVGIKYVTHQLCSDYQCVKSEYWKFFNFRRPICSSKESGFTFQHNRLEAFSKNTNMLYISYLCANWLYVFQDSIPRLLLSIVGTTPSIWYPTALARHASSYASMNELNSKTLQSSSEDVGFFQSIPPKNRRELKAQYSFNDLKLYAPLRIQNQIILSKYTL